MSKVVPAGDTSRKASPTVEGAAEDNEACVVCFKNVEIYSIGECDHPVCYECSTRMRVLCQQNECPICRQILSKVIFTHDKLPYRELEAKNRSEYYSKKYKIGFYSHGIQQKFFELLDHPCPKCNTPPYRTFPGLKNHVRKEHDLHYCELCTEHLKIFTFERRCYTQEELSLHLAKGDTDNTSHRGHPLCEYCKKRFLDRDELFRHLRREHYFCHFCDADGCNEFYRDYDALAEHFRNEHFLCEEGKCATEQFVGAFRSDIDYKAHVATVHGRTLNKQQAKQTRTLQLEITLGPRGRSAQSEQGIANVRSRGGDEDRVPTESNTSQKSQQGQRSITIDAQNEQDFPSLGGSTATTNLSLTRPPPPSMRNRSAAAGLARTKENFPALGPSASGGSNRTHPQSTTPISTVLRKSPASSTGAIARTQPGSMINGSTGMVIHVSNRPAHTTNGTNTPTKKTDLDFPLLAVPKSKKHNRALDEDMIHPSTSVPLENVSAKHRTLLDDYVSVANPTNFQKIQTVKKEESDAKLTKTNVPKLTSQDFPSLGGGGVKESSSASWVRGNSEKKQRESENRKSKVAPTPQLPNAYNKQSTATKTAATYNNNNQNVTETAHKKEKKQKEKKTPVEVHPSLSKDSQKFKEKNNNEKKSTNANMNNNTAPQAALVNGDDNSSSQSMRPPPGFLDQQNILKPPPGFHSNVTLNSVAKSPNNLTFTSSLGESYSIVPAHAYIQPPEAITRNQRLFSQFKDNLHTKEALEEFRHISQSFREGVYKAPAFYEHCQSALKDNFDKVFPELLALLPDISKQQALYLVHTQRLNTMAPSERIAIPKLEVCSTCKQVLLANDLGSHQKLHNFKENFPQLSGNVNKTCSGNRK